MVVVRIDPDDEDPCQFEEWELLSFHTRYGPTCTKPWLYLLPPDGRPANLGMARRLKTGTAFVLSLYAHSDVVWGLQGEVPQCPWDTTRIAGILLWSSSPKELPKTLEERREDARRFLKLYTAWANGAVYAYTIDDEENVRCGGFIETADLFQSLYREVDPGEEIQYVGEASWLARYAPERKSCEQVSSGSASAPS